ncbi:MAG: hypothetical protein KDB05_00670 [Planctomycetales bacterium]|nr:hypothetical protein [Planctomycetales bacterium]
MKPRVGEGVSQFAMLRDMRTDTLAERIAAEMELLGYGKPYLVAARFDRKFIDVNRGRQDAYEDPLAQPHYDAYHQAIDAACQEIIQHWGRGLLLDIHGTSTEPNTIFRGTNDGKTASHLVNRFGNDSLRGPTSLFGRFAAAGYTVNPGIGSEAPESARHRGGYTVRSYGSREGRTIDAIQLEFGSALRATTSLDRTSKDFASAIVEFASTYLPKDAIDRLDEQQAELTLFVPAYSYPAGQGLRFWNELIAAADNVPIVAIANPASGPGTARDENYSNVLERAAVAGIRLIGYVTTDYARRKIADVDRDVDRWTTLYPMIDGIFFDEQSSDREHVEYYSTLSQHTRAKIPNAFLASNPGMICAKEYVASQAFDVICVFENREGYDRFHLPDWAAPTDSTKFAALPYGELKPDVAQRFLRQTVSMGVSYIYVTHDSLPNPWDEMASYWNQEVSVVRQINMATRKD